MCLNQGPQFRHRGPVISGTVPSQQEGSRFESWFRQGVPHLSPNISSPWDPQIYTYRDIYNGWMAQEPFMDTNSRECPQSGVRTFSGVWPMQCPLLRRVYNNAEISGASFINIFKVLRGVREWSSTRTLVCDESSGECLAVWRMSGPYLKFDACLKVV